MSMFASEDVQQFRMAVCEGCPKLTILKTCQICGCVMPFKVKIKTARCPLGIWVEEHGQRTIQEETYRSS